MKKSNTQKRSIRFAYEARCFVKANFCFVYEMEAKMQFEKCLTCPSIKDKGCSGPKFMRASTKNVVEWLFAYMKLNGITNTRLAAASGVPKGTIDGLKHREDVRHETLYPLLKAAIELTGGVWDGEHCPATENLMLAQELEQTKNLLEKCERAIKERTRAIYALFGLCLGLVVLLILLSL